MKSLTTRLVLVLLSTLFCVVPTAAFDYNYSFESILEGWKAVGSGGIFTIAPSTNMAENGYWSVRLRMTPTDLSAFTCIEKPFYVVPGYEYNVRLSWKFASQDTDVGRSSIIASATVFNSVTDYHIVSSTYNGGSGNWVWLSKEYNTRVTPTSDGIIYIGLGVESSFDYTYYIDSVTVELIPIGRQTVSISGARKLADGVPVLIEHKGCASGVSDIIGIIYIEELDRTSGIAVEPVQDTLWPSRNDLVIVEGFLDSTEGGERIIRNAHVSYSPLEIQISPNIQPLYITNKAVGGEPFGDYVPGIFGSVGLNNTGLLIKTTGKVVHQGDGFFVIDDGGRNEPSGKAPNMGIAVSTTGVVPWNPITLPDNPGQMSVTGLVTCWKDPSTGKVYPFIQPRCGDDVVPLDK